MSFENQPPADGQIDRWPRDEELTAYLLGVASPADRRRIEVWLSADADHGDQLCQLASVVLLASVVPADAVAVNPPPSASAVTHRFPLRRRQVATLLALAASSVLALFSFKSLDPDQSTHGRVAMAWAESRPRSEVSDRDDISRWLSDQSGILDTAGLAPLHETADHEPAEQHAAEPLETFGFSNSEPPEWLLAAVSQMQVEDRSLDRSEDKR